MDGQREMFPRPVDAVSVTVRRDAYRGPWVVDVRAFSEGVGWHLSERYPRLVLEEALDVAYSALAAAARGGPTA